MDRRFIRLTLLILFASCGAALGMAMWEDIPPGRVYPNSRDGKPPAGLEELMNYAGRVHGESGFFSELGSWQILDYVGDTAAFNDFIDRYAKLGIQPMEVRVMQGPGMLTGIRGIQQPKSTRYDWSMRWDVYDKYRPKDPAGKELGDTLFVTLWAGGQVKLEKVKWPKGVTVERGKPRATTRAPGVTPGEKKPCAEKKPVK